ncbi:MAG: adenylate/guanylate cyclase domain-containing protein [Gammaproteobacteria bacterium]
MSDKSFSSSTDSVTANTPPTSKSMRLGQKFALTGAALMILSMCVFWLVTNQTTENILRQQADSLGTTLARQTAILVTELVLANDMVSMNVLLNQLTREPAIAQVAVLSIEDQVIAISGSSNSSAGESLFGTYVAPIALQDSLAGYVRVNLDQHYIEQGVTRSFLFMIAALLLLALTAIAVIYAMIQHFVSFPLSQLSASIQSVRHAQPEPSPFGERDDEVGSVIRLYNRLIYELEDEENRQEIFGPEAKVTPKSASETVYRRPGSAFVSIVNINISNYRSALHQHEAQETIELLNTYYFYIHKVTKLYNGNIEKCAGDEILITFGAAQADDEHCFHAVCAALLFLEITSTLARELEAQGLPTLQFKAGLHCGELLTGVLSSLEQNTYTVAGENLALTRQICKEAPLDMLIISEAAYLLADADSRLITEEFTDVVDDKNGEFIKTWLVDEAMPNYKALLDRQVEHLLAEEISF